MARFCTDKWDIKGQTNYDMLTMHLTNYAINKESDAYVKGEGEHGLGGSKRSLQCVLDTMKELGTNTDKLMSDIEDLFVKTLITIQPELSHHYRTCQPGDIERDLCFELLGFDVYIDKNA